MAIFPNFEAGIREFQFNAAELYFLFTEDMKALLQKKELEDKDKEIFQKIYIAVQQVARNYFKTAQQFGELTARRSIIDLRLESYAQLLSTAKDKGFQPFQKEFQRLHGASELLLHKFAKYSTQLSVLPFNRRITDLNAQPNFALGVKIRMQFEEQCITHPSDQSIVPSRPVEIDKTENIVNNSNDIGFLLSNRGKHEDAIKYYEMALTLKKATLGENHSEVAIILNNIGNCFNAQGKYEEALTCYVQDLKIKIEAVGKNHPDVTKTDVADSLNNVANCLFDQENYATALGYYKAALTIEALCENHSEVTLCLNDIGICLEKLDQFDEALTYFQKALEMLEETKSENHPYIAIILFNIGICLFNQRKCEESKPYLRNAYKLANSLDKEHPIINRIESICETDKSTDLSKFLKECLQGLMISKKRSMPEQTSSINKKRRK